jgi:hypothetical protein
MDDQCPIVDRREIINQLRLEAGRIMEDTERTRCNPAN